MEAGLDNTDRLSFFALFFSTDSLYLLSKAYFFKFANGIRVISWRLGL